MKISLRAARVNAGYSQTEAAKEVGINKDTLFRYEKDSTSIPRNIIVRLEELYNVQSDNIFFGVESEHFRILNTLRKEKV